MLTHKWTIRFVYSLVVLLVAIFAAGLILLLESKKIIFSQSMSELSQEIVTESTKPFPVGVFPKSASIVENIDVTDYFSGSIAITEQSQENWWNKIAAKFSGEKWFQNLASPISRIVVIWPGERKEEVEKNIGDILGWNEEDRKLFITLIDSTEPIQIEGKYFPGSYVVHKGTSPQEMYREIYIRFDEEILTRYTGEVESTVPLAEAMVIASLLEREASDFENMREVSGVIWNRLFIDMPLQLDATLQYVRGSSPHVKAWWPIVKPSDKFLDSPYNTYQNTGLPPAPIANPSAEAILAALNPRQTDCLFYFHDSKKNYYCSQDYKTHVSKLKSIYGRGK